MQNKPYEVFLADTPQSKDIHFNLRYQVYCEETEYEDVSRFPDKNERDEFDAHSAHFIVRCNSTGKWIAAMRLVLQEEEKHTIPVLEHGAIDAEYIGLCDGALEISRLCILKNYRGSRGRRVVSITSKNNHNLGGIQKSPINDRKIEAKRECTIMLSLIHAAFVYGVSKQIDNGTALMAESLARILKMSGFDAKSIGAVCDFRGPRRPYLFDIKAIATNFMDLQSGSRAVDFSSAGFQRFSEISADQKIYA